MSEVTQLLSAQLRLRLWQCSPLHIALQSHEWASSPLFPSPLCSSNVPCSVLFKYWSVFITLSPYSPTVHSAHPLLFFQFQFKQCLVPPIIIYSYSTVSLCAILYRYFIFYCMMLTLLTSSEDKGHASPSHSISSF